MTVKVSVVVPVYNPGKAIEPCIASLLGQSMPAGELELIFVDDGSTDATPARLDRLAEEHEHVTVIHIPNSGWPGRPRNVGTDAARGEYVQYVDQDDTMGPEALERMYALGHRNGSDIVFGKVTSDFRGVPHGVFRQTVEHCTIHDGPLIDSLTPHKMFRRQFLDEHAIRYAEGRRRLEDQLFMVQTYFPARSVSILGDYPCYFYYKRKDGKNSGSARLEPVGYYDNLREVLDVVDANTEPGEFRSGLLRRFYRVEMLSRVSEPAILKWPADYRREIYTEIRRLALERFPDDVPEGLAPVLRLRAKLLREDRLGDLVEFARRTERIEARAYLDDLSWRDGALRAQVRAHLAWKDGEPLRVVEEGGRRVLDPLLTEGLFQPGDADVGEALEAARVEVVIRDRTTAVEWFVPAEMTMQLPEAGASRGGRSWSVEFSGEAVLDPLTLAGGVPLPRGAWDVALRVHLLGVARRTRVGSRRSARVEPHPLPAVHGRLAVIPYFTQPFGNLSLDVDRFNKSLTGSVHLAGVRGEAAGDGESITLPLDLVALPGTGELAAQVVVHGDPGQAAYWVPARLVPDRGRMRAVAGVGEGDPGAVAALRPGKWPVAVRLEPGYGETAAAGFVVVDGDGLVTRRTAGLAPVRRRLATRLGPRRVLRSARLRSTVRRAALAAPGPVGRLVLRHAGRLRRWADRGDEPG